MAGSIYDRVARSLDHYTLPGAVARASADGSGAEFTAGAARPNPVPTSYGNLDAYPSLFSPLGSQSIEAYTAGGGILLTTAWRAVVSFTVPQEAGTYAIVPFWEAHLEAPEAYMNVEWRFAMDGSALQGLDAMRPMNAGVRRLFYPPTAEPGRTLSIEARAAIASVHIAWARMSGAVIRSGGGA